MICPNCREPNAVLGEYTDFVLHWICKGCVQYGMIGEKEIDEFLNKIGDLGSEIWDLSEESDLAEQEIKDLKAEIADLNRLASDYD